MLYPRIYGKSFLCTGVSTLCDFRGNPHWNPRNCMYWKLFKTCVLLLEHVIRHSGNCSKIVPTRVSISWSIPGSMEKVSYVHEFPLGPVSTEKSNSAESIRKVSYGGVSYSRGGVGTLPCHGTALLRVHSGNCRRGSQKFP